MTDKVDVAILGAGIAGLGASLGATEKGRKPVVFEALGSAGGLLDNFIIDGYRFDHAVHLSFATEPKVREIFDKTPYWTHPADSMCFEEGRWLKHPVQNNLFPLPPQEKVDLLRSFLARPEKLTEDHYEAWLRHQYGDAIAERFPLVYTKKYWATEARELSTTWVGNRMRRASLDEILFGAFTDDTPNTYYTKEMRYPKVGGFKSFIRPVIDAATIQYNKRAGLVNPGSHTVEFMDGTKVQYEDLVSTLPLPEWPALCNAMPEVVREGALSLKATSIDLISVGFENVCVKDLWFYIYDSEIFASRAYSPSIKSPENVPAGKSSLQFEIYNYGKSSTHSPADMISNTRAAIQKMKISRDEDIRFMHHKHLDYGNVIFERGMEDRRQVVLDWLKEQGVHSCGRFGAWDYFWSNQSFLSGYGALSNETK